MNFLKDVKKYLRVMGTFWEGVKREALKRLGQKGSVCRSVSLRWLGDVVSC